MLDHSKNRLNLIHTVTSIFRSKSVNKNESKQIQINPMSFVLVEYILSLEHITLIKEVKVAAISIFYMLTYRWSVHQNLMYYIQVFCLLYMCVDLIYKQNTRKASHSLLYYLLISMLSVRNCVCACICILLNPMVWGQMTHKDSNTSKKNAENVFYKALYESVCIEL